MAGRVRSTDAMDEQQYYILLKHHTGLKLKRRFRTQYTSAAKTFTTIVKGEILTKLPEQKQPEDKTLMSLKPFERPSYIVECPKTDVQELDKEEADLLLPLSSMGRLKILQERDKLKSGKKMKVGSAVWVNVKVDHIVAIEFEGVVKYKGPLPGYTGTMFGVEMVGFTGKGTTDGCFMSKYYFHCQKDNGVFVSLDKLSLQKEVYRPQPQIGEIRTVIVSGISPHTTDDTLNNFFENKRRSGGGEIKYFDRVQPDVVHVTFASSEVAKNVLERVKLEVDGYLLKLQPKRPQVVFPLDKKKVFIENINPKTSKDSLINYIERTTKQEVDELVLGSNNDAMVTLNNEPDIDKVTEHAKKRKLEGATLKISHPPVCNSILVTGISKDKTMDGLELRFDNPKYGGGEILNVIYQKSKGKAIISFLDPSVIDTISSQNHTLNDSTLTTRPCYPFMENSVVDEIRNEEKIIQVNEDIMNHVSNRCNEEFSELFGFSTSKLKYDENKKEVMISGKKDIQDKVADYINQFEVNEIPILESLVIESKDELQKIVTSIKENDQNTSVEFDEEKQCILVTGKKKRVKKCEENIEKKLEELEKIKQVITTTITLDQQKLLLIYSLGFEEQFDSQPNIEVKIKLQDNAIEFKGSKDLVNEAKVKALEEYSKVKDDYVEVNRRQEQFLASGGLDVVNKHLKDKGIKALMCLKQSKRGKAKVVFADSEKNEEVLRFISEEIFEKSCTLEGESEQILESESWMEEKKLCNEFGIEIIVPDNEEDNMRVWLIGEKTKVKRAFPRLEKFIEANSIVNESITFDEGISRYLAKHCQLKIDGIERSQKEQMVKIKTNEDGTFTLQGTKNGAKEAIKKLENIAESLEHSTITIEQPGMQKYFKSEAGKTSLHGIESDLYCAITVTNNKENRSMKILPVTNARRSGPSTSGTQSVMGSIWNYFRSDSTAATTVNESTMANPPLFLKVYTEQKRTIEKVREKIATMSREQTKREIVERDQIEKLSKAQVIKISDIGKKNNVEVKIEQPIKRIIVCGHSEDVPVVLLEINVILNGITMAEHEKETAEILSQNVKWFWSDDTGDEDEIEYDKTINSQIEKAYAKKEKSVHFELEEGKCIINFEKMEERNLRSGQTIKVSRKDLSAEDLKKIISACASTRTESVEIPNIIKQQQEIFSKLKETNYAKHNQDASTISQMEALGTRSRVREKNVSSGETNSLQSLATSIDAIPAHKLESLVECPVCLETLNDPRTLPCNHSLCNMCLHKMFERQCKQKVKRPDVIFNCPVCNYELPLDEKGVETITGSHFIRNLVDILSEERRVKVVPCNHCEQPSVARCLRCNVFTCEACSKVHDNALGCRGHEGLSKNEVPKPENWSTVKVRWCKEHRDEILKYFCDTCQHPICGDCMVFNHADHKRLPLKNVAERKRNDLKARCSKLSQEIEECNLALIAIDISRQSLEEKMGSAKERIKERKEEILAIVKQSLDNQERLLVDGINKVYLGKREVIKNELEATEKYTNDVQKSINVCEGLLKNEEPIEIVTSYSLMCEEIDQVYKSQRKSSQTVKDNDLPFYQYPMVDVGKYGEQLAQELGSTKQRNYTVILW